MALGATSNCMILLKLSLFLMTNIKQELSMTLIESRDLLVYEADGMDVQNSHLFIHGFRRGI